MIVPHAAQRTFLPARFCGTRRLFPHFGLAQTMRSLMSRHPGGVLVPDRQSPGGHYISYRLVSRAPVHGLMT